jgi:hypothetical protein
MVEMVRTLTKKNKVWEEGRALVVVFVVFFFVVADFVPQHIKSTK